MLDRIAQVSSRWFLRSIGIFDEFLLCGSRALAVFLGENTPLVVLLFDIGR